MTRLTITSSTAGAVTGDAYMDNVSEHIRRLWDASALPLSAVGGTGNAVTATLAPPLLAGLVEGMKFSITWAAGNTAAVTLALNGGTAVPVLDATGAALTAGSIAAGTRALLEYVGSSFRILSGGAGAGGTLGPRIDVITASGTWTKPTGYDANTPVMVQAWGAGGSGGRGAEAGGGGGGGAYAEIWLRYGDLLSSYTATIGAGGAGRTTNSNGIAGGNTSFGSLLTAFGGGGGAQTGTAGTAVNGGGGGGELAAGATPASNSSRADIGGGAGLPSNVNAATIWAGGAGGNGSSTGSTVGGNAVYGGGGGGGGGSGGAGAAIAGGISKFGGAGGIGRDAGGSLTGIDGSAPGGGGGGSEDQLSGSGARGEIRVWIFG